MKKLLWTIWVVAILVIVAAVFVRNVQKDAHSGIKAWEDAYHNLDQDRVDKMVETINTPVDLPTSGLSDRVRDTYQDIEDALLGASK